MLHAINNVTCHKEWVFKERETSISFWTAPPNPKYSHTGNSQYFVPSLSKLLPGSNVNDISYFQLLCFLAFCFIPSLSKLLELEEPWLDSSWHLEVTTEKLEDLELEGVKEILAEGEVGGELDDTVREIEDVCIGEVFSHIHPQK